MKYQQTKYIYTFNISSSCSVSPLQKKLHHIKLTDIVSFQVHKINCSDIQQSEVLISQLNNRVSSFDGSFEALPDICFGLYRAV
jgi:hypothetical protein